VRPWTSGWGSVLAVALAVIALAEGDALRGLYSQQAPETILTPAMIPAMFLWTLLAVAAFLVAAGMILRWRRDVDADLRRRPDAPARLLCRAGWMVSATILLLALVGLSVEPVSRAALTGVAGAASAFGRDVLQLVAGQGIADGVVATYGSAFGVVRSWGGFGWSLMVMVVIGVFALHMLALRDVRWARSLAGVLWLLVLALGVTAACALAARLFAAGDEASYATGLGRLLAASATWRLALLALILAVLLWVWGGVRALLRYEEAAVRINVVEELSGVFAHLMSFGMVASGVALVVSVLLMPKAWGEAFFFPLHYSVLPKLGALTGGVAEAGRAAAAWPGYFAALLVALVVLLAAHQGTRQGKLRTFAWTAALWTLLMLWMGTAIVDMTPLLAWPVQPGAPVFMLVSIGFWLVITAGVLVLWLRWWRQRNRWEDDLSEWTGEVAWTTVPAYFGRLGNVLFVVLGGGALLGLLSSHPAGSAWLGQLCRGLERVQFGGAFALERMRSGLEATPAPGLLAWMLVLLALVSLVLHYFGQRAGGHLKWALVTLWSVVVLVCVFCLGRVLEFGTFGRWSAPRALTSAGLVAVTLGLLNVTACCWVWLIKGSDRRAS